MKLPVYSSTIRRKEMDAVLTCMVAEKVGPGEMNQKLAQIAKEFLQIEGSGVFRSTAVALFYALSALDVEIGSGIIISALAPAWHYQVVKRLGFVPFIADVDPDNLLITVDSLTKAIQSGGRVILLHETLGFIPDMTSILALGIPVIEDISQSVGASILDQKAGQFGVFSILGLEEHDLLTAGGGAILLAKNHREAIVLKKMVDEAPLTDILPDINSALAFIQFREFQKNIAFRKEIHTLYVRSIMQSRHKTIIQSDDVVSAVYAFPVVLSSGYKEVKQYVNRKEVEIELAFDDSVAAFLGDELEGCIQAKSLLMRCVLFPLYPRLGTSNATKIAKIMATLP